MYNAGDVAEFVKEYMGIVGTIPKGMRFMAMGESTHFVELQLRPNKYGKSFSSLGVLVAKKAVETWDFPKEYVKKARCEKNKKRLEV